MRNLLIWAAFCVGASSAAHAGLVVEDGHVRALPPGVDNTSAYMKLKNPDAQARVLVSINSPAAGKITLHDTMNHNGMLHMQSLEKLTIPAGGSVSLEPGATHLMLEELVADLEPGSQVELILIFADGQQQTITLPVKSVLDE